MLLGQAVVKNYHGNTYLQIEHSVHFVDQVPASGVHESSYLDDEVLVSRDDARLLIVILQQEPAGLAYLCW